jgi:ferredoxin
MKKGIDLNCDNLGVVFPVYMWGVPLIVKEFLSKIKTDKYIFAVATYGGSKCGTLIQVKKILGHAGSRLSYGSSVKMPGNYIPMYGAISDLKQKKMFEYEKQKIKKICEDIKNKKNAIETGFHLLNMLLSGIVYNLGSKHLHSMDKSFYSDEKCNSCNICEKVCPVKNIKMNDKKLEWQHKCEQCFACLQWCPAEAIQ